MKESDFDDEVEASAGDPDNQSDQAEPIPGPDLSDHPKAGAGNEVKPERTYLPPSDEEDPWTKGEVPESDDTPASPVATQPVGVIPPDEDSAPRPMPIIYYDGCRRQARETLTITIKRGPGGVPVFETRIDGREISMLNQDTLVVHIGPAAEYFPGAMILDAEDKPVRLDSIEQDVGTARGGAFRQMLQNLRRIIALPTPIEREAIPTAKHERQM